MIDSPSILIPLVTSFEAASSPHCAMRDTHSSLLNSIVGTSLMAAPSSIFFASPYCVIKHPPLDNDISLSIVVALLHDLLHSLGG